MANREEPISHEHLSLIREVPITERHRQQDRRPRFRPNDPREFAKDLSIRLKTALDDQPDIASYDEGCLLKIVHRQGESLPELEAIHPGIEIISQEGRSIVIALTTVEGA